MALIPMVKLVMLVKALTAGGARDAVTGAIIPTALDVAGRGVGRGLREVLNKKRHYMLPLKAEITNGTKAAQQATDATGKPVTQSLSLTQQSLRFRMSMEDLSNPARNAQLV